MRKRDWSVIFLLVGLGSIFFVPESKADTIKPPPYSDMQGKVLSTIECLAVNSYWEGRSESDIANLAIMTSVYARSLLGGRYGDSVCEVVFKPYAYSWTNDGLSDKIHNEKQYQRLYKLAEKFLMNKDSYLEDFEYTNHYHVKGLTTNWDYSKLTYIGQFDDHVFYRHK